MKKSFVTHIIHIIKKLTILDWIVCVLLLTVAGYFLVNRTSKEQLWINVTLRVAGDEWYYGLATPQYWYAEGLTKGANAYNSFGTKIAEIQSVENYDVGGPNRMIIAHLKLLITRNKKLSTDTFNYQTLEIGKPLDLTFGSYNLHGLITDIESSTQYVMTNIELKVLAVYPWQATSYQPGLQMKDLEGNTVATITNVDVQETQAMKMRDLNGELIVIPSINNPYKDVTLQLTVKSYIINGIPYYIDGSALKIGNSIWIEFPHTTIHNASISNVY